MSQNSPHFFSSFSNTATKRERQKNDFFYVIYKIKKMADNKCTTTTDKIAQNDKHNKLAQNENRACFERFLSGKSVGSEAIAIDSERFLSREWETA